MEPSALEIFAQATAAQNDPRPLPRAALIFAHPDDETIALGARLARFAGAHMVHVTDGAPRNAGRAHGFHSLSDYRQARWQELQQMLETAGIPNISRERLEIADRDASLELTRISRRIAEILQAHRSEVVFTHPYEGGHPDHDACAFAVHHAVAMLRGCKDQVPLITPPLIIEAPFYHADPAGIDVGMETGTFLPAGRNAPERQKTKEVAIALSPEEQKCKRALIECFQTQRETLSCFQLTEERFRIAPEYEFRLPPHNGAVFYDSRPWGMSSQSFCDLASEAERALGGRNENRMLTVLCTAFPFAPVSVDAAEGAEQILSRLDSALDDAVAAKRRPPEVLYA